MQAPVLLGMPAALARGALAGLRVIEPSAASGLCLGRNNLTSGCPQPVDDFPHRGD